MNVLFDVAVFLIASSSPRVRDECTGACRDRRRLIKSFIHTSAPSFHSRSHSSRSLSPAERSFRKFVEVFSRASIYPHTLTSSFATFVSGGLRIHRLRRSTVEFRSAEERQFQTIQSEKASRCMPIGAARLRWRKSKKGAGILNGRPSRRAPGERRQCAVSYRQHLSPYIFINISLFSSLALLSLNSPRRCTVSSLLFSGFRFSVSQSSSALRSRNDERSRLIYMRFVERVKKTRKIAVRQRPSFPFSSASSRTHCYK